MFIYITNANSYFYDGLSTIDFQFHQENTAECKATMHVLVDCVGGLSTSSFHDKLRPKRQTTFSI